MPYKDKKAPFARIELRGTITFEKAIASGQVIVAAGMTTQWCWDSVYVQKGIEISAQGIEGAGPGLIGTYAYVRIPLLGVDLPITLSSTVIVTGGIPYVVQIDDGVLYSMAGGGWRLKFSALRVYLNGSLVHSEGATTLDNTYFFSTSGIPLLGIPPRYTASAAVNPVPMIGAVDHSTVIGSSESYGKARITDAAWRFQTPGSSEWQGLPVLVDLLDVPTDDECDCPSPDPATLTAETTSSVEISAEQHLERETTLHLTGQPLYCTNGPATSGHVDVYKSRLTWWGNSAQVTTVPNLPASVKRIGPGHREVVYRGGMPRTQRTAFHTCGVDGVGSGVHTIPAIDEVHPRQSRLIAVVGNDTHPIEDTLSFPVPAPAEHSEFRYESFGYTAQVVGPVACPMALPEEPPGTVLPPTAPPDEICYVTQGAAFTPIVDDDIDNPDLLPYLYHADPLVRYVNYWGSRHWSFFDWFPRNTIDTDDDGIPDAQNIWKVFLDKISNGYWLSKGDQYCEHPSLPVAERTLRRTTLFTAPLLYGSQAGFIEGVFGAPASWWGDETFRVDAASPLTELELNELSETSWVFEDCSGTFGVDGITLTPDPGKTIIKAKVALGSFTQWPYLFPHIASEFEVDWEPANIVQVVVELVGHSGSKVELTRLPGRFLRPSNGSDSIYSGSYAQDLGQFYFDDKGFDLLDPGDSEATMVDPERVHAFSLLAGRTAAELLFTIEVASDSSDCEIKFPVLYPSADQVSVFPENRSNHAVVWPDGPGVRFGNVAHYYGGSLHATPLALPPGVPPLPGVKLAWMPSPVDWICFKNLVLRADPHDQDIATQLATFFDSVEAPAGTEDADESAIAMLIPRGYSFPYALIVNGAGCPPVCVWPSRIRNELTLAQTGAWGLQTWSYAEERRFYIGNEAMSLNGPDVYTSLLVPEVSGWPVTFHRQAVTNNEGFHVIRHGADGIGAIRPWQGCLIARRPASGEIGREPDVLHIPDGLRWEALVIYDETLERDSMIVRRSHGQPKLGFETQVEVANGEEASFPSLAYVPWGRLWVGYTRFGALRYRASDDDGQTWEAEVSLINPGYFGRIVSNPEGETLAVAFRYNSGGAGVGKIYFRFQGPGDTAMSAATAIQNNAGSEITFEPESFGLSWDPSVGAWSLFAKKGGDPGPTRFFSIDDGASWTEVT